MAAEVAALIAGALIVAYNIRVAVVSRRGRRAEPFV
jgi:hypothetical protein